MPRPKKGADSSEPVVKFQGYLVFLVVTGEDAGSYERYETKRGLLRNNSELVIDFDTGIRGQSSFLYTITLRREDPLVFRGEYSGGKAAERDTGRCLCRWYRTGERFALAGVWKQSGQTDQWFGEFTVVDSFADQKQVN